MPVRPGASAVRAAPGRPDFHFLQSFTLVTGDL
jgi:hypothetical protein